MARPMPRAASARLLPALPGALVPGQEIQPNYSMVVTPNEAGHLAVPGLVRSCFARLFRALTPRHGLMLRVNVNLVMTSVTPMFRTRMM